MSAKCQKRTRPYPQPMSSVSSPETRNGMVRVSLPLATSAPSTVIIATPPFANSASIILEIDNDGVLAGVQCILRSNGSSINTYAVQHRGRLHANGFEDGRIDVDHAAELGADPALVLDPCGPGDHETIARSAEVRRYLFSPLERRVHSVGPNPLDND